MQDPRKLVLAIMKYSLIVNVAYNIYAHCIKCQYSILINLLVKSKIRFIYSCCLAPGVSAQPAQDNMRYFHAIIAGPVKSPYEGTSI